MKDKLTKEQSAHLISLGVPKEKATGNYSEIEMFDYPIFTLVDILSILPKEIDHSKLYMIWNGGEWNVGYSHYDGEELYPTGDIAFVSCKHNPELIDSLYSLCVWCLENNYLKFEKL